MVSNKKQHWLDISYTPLLISAVLTIGVVFSVYNQTRSIMKERLRERLTAIAGTAALQFEGDELKNIQDESDINSPVLNETVERMKDIRDANQNLRYIYIWRKTANPDFVEFIADAEMLDPIDIDNNGIIEGEEIPPAPGEDYDIREIPPIEEGFTRPMAQQDFIIDRWGTFLSGFAPIKDSQGNTEAILGIDVEITDFNILVNATLIPFIALATVLLLMLTIQTIALIRIWRNRVDIVKELDRQKDELLSIVSHQLAAPVTAIKWYLETLKEDGLDSLNKEQIDSVNSMESITMNLSDLVTMILDVSRIQLGKMKVEPQELDLNKFFSEILTVIKPKAQEKNINFDIHVPQSLPVASLDKRLTRMTIENLLTNAIKYTPEKGKVTFSVNIQNNILICEVEDTGCGIPLKDQDQIFGKLFRASNVRNSIDGNGFGLYIAKGAIESQNGKIWFDSKENSGTQFHIRLPI